MGALAMIILQNLISDLIASAGPGNTIRVTCDIRDFQHQVNRKPQTAVTRLQFRVPEISNFSKMFSSVQFIFIQPKYNTIQEYIQEL